MYTYTYIHIYIYILNLICIPSYQKMAQFVYTIAIYKYLAVSSSLAVKESFEVIRYSQLTNSLKNTIYGQRYKSNALILVLSYPLSIYFPLIMSLKKKKVFKRRSSSLTSINQSVCYFGSSHICLCYRNQYFSGNVKISTMDNQFSFFASYFGNPFKKRPSLTWISLFVNSAIKPG